MEDEGLIYKSSYTYIYNVNFNTFPSFQVENECGEVPTVIVQNKIDLMDQAVVSL